MSGTITNVDRVDGRSRSIVRARFDEFLGSTVAIRVTWLPQSLVLGELVDVVAVGKDYFVRMRFGKRTKLINTRALLELGLAEGE